MYWLLLLLCLGLSVDDDVAEYPDTSEELAQYQATEQQGKQPLPHFLMFDTYVSFLHAIGYVPSSLAITRTA